MGDFINGVGTLDSFSDLSQLDITDEGYPVLKPGYFFVNNVEYYLFASGVITPLASGIIENLDYQVGTPYFIINSESDVYETTNNLKYIDTSKKIAGSGIWDYDVDNSNFSFDGSNFTDKYLVFDSGIEFYTNTKLIESALLILSNESKGDTFNIDLNPSLFSFTKVGSNVYFYTKVTDTNGTLLENKQLNWFKICNITNPDHLALYDTIYASGINNYLVCRNLGSSTTDVNGIATFDFSVNDWENNACIFAQDGTNKSKLQWVDVIERFQNIIDVFQIEESELATQDALTALGMDAWGYFWNSPEGITNENKVTEQPENIPNGIFDRLRGDWKDTHERYQRPPIDTINTVIMASGSFNAEDYANIYPIIYNDVTPLYTLSASGVIDYTTLWTFMKIMRVSIGGYWGQILVKGEDFIGNTFPNCLNPDDVYTVDYDVVIEEGNTFIDLYRTEDEKGITGSWNFLMNELAADRCKSNWYVLYAHTEQNVIGDTTYFQNNNFYFRGLGTIYTNAQDLVKYKKQLYTIEDLVPLNYLQKY